MELASLKINPAAIEAGRWVKDIPDMGDLELLVRGLNNADYRKLQRQLLQAVPRGQRSALTPAQADEITGTLLLETCLLDWKNLTESKDSPPLPYSKALASDLLLKPEFGRFREAVAYAAATVGDEQADEQEADVKN